MKLDMKLEQLLTLIETNFDCKLGRPYRFALPEEAYTSSEHRARHCYAVFEMRFPELTANAEERLCEALWGSLREIRLKLPETPNPILYWRYPGPQRIEGSREGGYVRLYTRICIPDAYPVTRVERPYMFVGER